MTTVLFPLPRVAAPALALLALLWTVPASAGTTQEAVDALADKVAAYLLARNQTRLVVHDFDKPGTVTADAALRDMLIRRLNEKHNIQTARTANLQLKGSLIRLDDGNGSGAVRLSAEMRDASNNPLGNFLALFRADDPRLVIDDQEDTLTLLGATVDRTTANPDAAPVAAPEAADQPLPGFHLDAAGGVFPHVGSLFGLELLVGDGPQGPFRPASVQNRAGLAGCDIRPGQCYRVRIHNRADHDVAVKLAVDGLNCFEHCKDAGYKAQGVWVIPAGRSGVISGWYVDNGLTHPFLVAAANGPGHSSQGTVTAVFFAAWAAGQQKPAVEPIGSRGSDRMTVPGPGFVRQPVTQVQRFIGVTPLAAVSIRYDQPAPAGAVSP